jgi:hypothetical protein
VLSRKYTADYELVSEVQIIVGAQHVVPLPMYFIYLKYAVLKIVIG